MLEICYANMRGVLQNKHLHYEAELRKVQEEHRFRVVLDNRAISTRF